MKTNTLGISLLAILLTATTVKAQEYKIPVQNTTDGKLSLVNFMGDLPIEGYSGNEIVITSADAEEVNIPERAKGLKPIYPTGTDNTGIGLWVEKNGNQVTVQCLLPITKRGEYKIKVPDNFSIKANSGCERSNEISIANMKNEIEINNCFSVNLKNVTGPLVISTISGNVDVVYSSVSTDKPVLISSVSGNIDVALPEKTPLNLQMKTITGTVYSDFDIAAEKNGMKQVGGGTIKSKLNGGGTDFKAVSVSGNIYLRKGK
jgi:hypothetical protein